MTVTPRETLIEAIRVASFESPKADSHTEWARRINKALDVYETLACPSEFRFTRTSDPYSLMVQGAFTVHDFANDPEIEDQRSFYKWGAYVVGRDWLVGFDTKEEAARAGWEAIMKSGDR